MTAKNAKRLLARCHSFWRENKRPGTSRRAITRSPVEVYGILVHLSRMGEVVPSIKYLAERTSYSRSTIVRALRNLKLAGLIAIQRRRKSTPEGSRQTSNRYTILTGDLRVPIGIDLGAIFRRPPRSSLVRQGVRGARELQEKISIEIEPRRVSGYSDSLRATLRYQRQYA